MNKIKKTHALFVCLCCMMAWFTILMGQAQTSYFYNSEKLLSSRITCISQDADGYIWIGTDCGLNRFDGYRFTEYVYQHNKPGALKSNFITKMFNTPDGQFWAGTSKGLMRYDKHSDSFEAIKTSDQENPHIASVAFTGKNQFLVGTAGHSLYRWDANKHLLVSLKDKYKSADNFFSRIFIDARGNLWKSGLNDRISCFDKNSHKERFIQTACGLPTAFLPMGKGFMVVGLRQLLIYQNGKLNADAIDMSHLQKRPSNFRIAVKDKQGNIFIGSYGQGLFVIPAGTSQMQQVPSPTPDFDLSTANIYSLYVDKEDNIWVGCNRKGVLMIPNRKAKFNTWRLSTQNYALGASISSICEGDNGLTWCVIQNVGIIGFDSEGRIVAHPKSPDNPFCITRDKEGRYWVGTDCALYSYDPTTGAYHLEKNVEGEYIKSIVDGGNGKLYLSSSGHGLVSFDKKTKATVNYQMAYSDKAALCNNWINTMLLDKRGLLWIGTASGISCYDTRTEKFIIQKDNSLAYSLVCISMAELPNGDIALGADNGLYLYQYKSKDIIPYLEANPLVGKMVMSILTMKNGDLWCSSSYGIWNYKRASHQFVNYLHTTGLATREYAPEIKLLRKDGTILFGINDGITTFNPNSIQQSNWNFGDIHLCNISIEGKFINLESEINGERVIDCDMTEAHDLTISYKSNSFTLELSTFNYANASNINYEYRINGSKTWQSTGVGNNDISFNRLPYGTYKLEVRAVVNGIYSPVKAFTIHVTPPWYHTTWAYLLYIALLLAISYYIYERYKERRRQKMEDDKTKVLFNATHDIRSPLTLIMSPLHKLQKREDLDEDAQKQLNVIERNANRILNLVNQILDIRKIDCQQIHLHCQKTNLVSYIQQTLKLYEYQGESRDIKLTFTHERENIPAWIDRQNFDKVINNLVSNSFKFTGVHGEIDITLSVIQDEKTQQNRVEITVKDTGIGLNGKDLNKIFERFYQAKDANETSHENGTGIGLNLCKMIVDMHHGKISAENRTDTHGSIFKILLPMGKEHLKPEEIEQEQAEITLNSNVSKPNALIVDDDPEIPRYIAAELKNYFNFASCNNGKEAMNLLHAEKFDIVISDVVMPVMDGFTMLRLIKTNPLFNHIPVIMLTSKSDVSNRLYGLEKGADAFLGKPFDTEELHLLMNNLIDNVRRLRGKFSGMQNPTEKIEPIKMKSNDEVLMEKVIKAINTHLSDSDFGVEELTQEIGISRAQLHRKMKDMTGIAASEFLRNIRLEQAARILSEAEVNVSQVAYQVGFSNQSYFSTSFKRHFGMSPTEYAEKNKKEKTE